jgi:hypothetical protein
MITKRGRKGRRFLLSGFREHIRRLSAYFKSETSILYPAATVNLINNSSHQRSKVKEIFCKLGASVRCWMDVPDLKCALKYRTSLSTRYVHMGSFYFSSHQTISNFYARPLIHY